MVVRDIQRIVESWAPKEIAWERDNVGLQIGRSNKPIRSVLVTLDVTDEVVGEAKRKKADLILSHHPLLFHPIKSIDTDERVGRLIEKLIQADITVCSAHTNLDFTYGGVSFALAEQLGLQAIDFLMKDKQVQKKIVVFVPITHVEKVFQAMANAGGGQLGNYESCAFRSKGTGSFTPKNNARPYLGKVGKHEEVEEIRLEMIATNWNVNNIIRAMLNAHPYEEVAYDVYGLANMSDRYGVGAIGYLEHPVEARKFLRTVSRSLNIPVLRYSGNVKKKIQKVATCGGSGSNLISAAIQKGADAFITADISYHRFEGSDDRILLVDGGHFETERPILLKLTQFLKKELARQQENIQVIKSSVMSNPVHYFLS